MAKEYWWRKESRRRIDFTINANGRSSPVSLACILLVKYRIPYDGTVSATKEFHKESQRMHACGCARARWQCDLWLLEIDQLFPLPLTPVLEWCKVRLQPIRLHIRHSRLSFSQKLSQWRKSHFSGIETVVISRCSVMNKCWPYVRWESFVPWRIHSFTWFLLGLQQWTPSVLIISVTIALPYYFIPSAVINCRLQSLLMQ